MNKIFQKEVVILFVFMLALPIVCAVDADRDGILDENDEFPYDFDNDGLTDDWELRNGLKVDVADSNQDYDNDGLSNLEEFQKGTDPLSADSDGDGIDDYTETEEIGMDPLVPKEEEPVIWPLIVVPILILIFIVVLYLMEKHKIDETIQRWLVVYKVKEAKRKQEKLKEKAMKQQKKMQHPKKFHYDINKIKKNKVNEVPKELHGLVKTLETPKMQRQAPVEKPKVPTAQHKMSFDKLKQVSGISKSKKDVFENLKKVK